MTLNTRLRPSSIANLEDQHIKKMNWHCKEGFLENFEVIEREFREYRGLQPLKIMINGPPHSGKTHFGQILAEKYRLPLVNIGDIIKRAKKSDHCMHQEVMARLEWAKDN